MTKAETKNRRREIKSPQKDEKDTTPPHVHVIVSLARRQEAFCFCLQAQLPVFSCLRQAEQCPLPACRWQRCSWRLNHEWCEGIFLPEWNHEGGGRTLLPPEWNQFEQAAVAGSKQSAAVHTRRENTELEKWGQRAVCGGGCTVISFKNLDRT